MKLKSIEEIKAYFEGKRDGITLFAYWKDGTQYVGICGNKLSQFILEINHEENIYCTQFSKGIEVWTK